MTRSGHIYCLIPQKYNENNKNIVAGISGLGVLLNRLNNNRALFEVISPTGWLVRHVQVQVNCSHWLVTVVYCPRFPEARQFKTVILSHSLQSTNPHQHSAFPCTACLNTYGPVSWMIDIRMTSILKTKVADGRLESYTTVQI